MLELGQETFRETVQKKGVVLVDFGAPWCPPCRVQEPILVELENEYGQRLVVAKVDADEEAELASQFEVMGLPTLLLFKDGELLDTMRGLHSREQISTIIDCFII
ncbi:thioredoxin family protein [Robertmurraya korlensis]|uniref:thioredoxin family protein n=1 Tax=Robertmurraya korlensis TaxID=519977 RepID=UPI000824F861|nr:thioredoxin family protein [Robertmurraya korlensis]